MGGLHAYKKVLKEHTGLHVAQRLDPNTNAIPVGFVVVLWSAHMLQLPDD